MGTVSDGVDYLIAHAITTSSSLEDIQISLDQTSSGIDAITLVQNGKWFFFWLLKQFHLDMISKSRWHVERSFQIKETQCIFPACSFSSSSYEKFTIIQIIKVI